jgi:hypothetical protein
MLSPRFFAPGVIDEFAVRGGGDPGRGILRYPLSGPTDNSRGEGVLHRFLCKIEGAGNADKTRYDAPGFVTEDRLYRAAKVIHYRVLL